MVIPNSILSFLPPSEGKKSYRLQASISLEEASEMEKALINPTLPFAGDTSTIIRTFIRAGLERLHVECQVDSASFIQSISPMLGSELLKWSSGVCDNFAVAATDHLAMAIESGDHQLATDVVTKISNTIDEVTNKSAKMMLKKSLTRRGFMGAVERLRQLLLDEGENVYTLDNMVAEQFT